MMVKKIYIGGTFDLFHYGHVNVFKNLKYQINKSSLQQIGAASKVKYVDYAFIMDTYENQPFFIEENNPDYIVMGSDWQSKDYFSQLCIDQKFLDRIGAEMLFVPYTDSISTTKIIDRVKKY
jgi:glycerol-3-phosphate cytidylyltransferase-like family protein